MLVITADTKIFVKSQNPFSNHSLTQRRPQRHLQTETLYWLHKQGNHHQYEKEGLKLVPKGSKVEEEEEDQAEEPEEGEDQERDKAVHQEKVKYELFVKIFIKRKSIPPLICSQ